MMKKGSFIYNKQKILYKIILKKDTGNYYFVYVKFKHQGDLFYKKTIMDDFNRSSNLTYVLERLDRMTEADLIQEIIKSIRIYEDKRAEKEEIKRLRKEWM